jgi:hypothetical protein
VDGSCAWCAGEQRVCLETAEHLFWLCAPARALWPHALRVASLLTKHRLLTVRSDAGGSPRLADYSSILFSQLPVARPLRVELPSSCVDVRAWRLVRGLALWTLWCLRNSLQSFPDRPAEPHFPAASAIPAFNARLKKAPRGGVLLPISRAKARAVGSACSSPGCVPGLLRAARRGAAPPHPCAAEPKWSSAGPCVAGLCRLHLLLCSAQPRAPRLSCGARHRDVH